MTGKTPSDLKIQPREIAFGRDVSYDRWWLGGDPAATAFHNALSVTFPMGERFFIDAVRHYRDRTSEPLTSQIADFVRQESMHSREHVFFNKQVTERGYDISKMERRLAWRIRMSRKAPPATRLGVTVALEHFTAILAHTALTNPHLMEGADPEAARMWRWHAMEEIEHKAVAFDTYMTVVGGGPVLRWLRRSIVMALVTLLFSYNITRNVVDFLAQDRLNNLRTWGRLFRYLWGPRGFLSSSIGAYFAFYLPGFHPWQVDDRPLIAGMQAEYA
jgi:predicted metal-dependent hydrolase